MLLTAERSILVVIDVQERLLPAIHEGERVIANVGTLLRAAARLGVPVLAAEQYPRGLGPTVAAVGALLPPGSIIEKTDFSAACVPGFQQRLERSGRDQIVVCGTEAHVCVLQTVLGLRQRGHAVYPVADATSSRTAANAGLAVERMRAAGATPVSTEMVVFEWLARAGTPAFKEVSALIR